ncbi:2-haloacid dehalogenase [Rhodococcus sp. 27YEA15]|uniref:haloacid dehalogenase type II n=1 Tax=Rhodococcus sp. 27YEA15 TaxID=3156259 RepID=UPI003C7C6F27
MREKIKALLFDVQGTATDFHSTLCREARRISDADVDWSRFVNRWRTEYFAKTSEAQSHTGKWVTVHSIYRTALINLLEREAIALSDAEQEELTTAWKFLDPWPDTVAGLIALRQQYTIAALSNADVDAAVSIARHGNLPWHAVFTAEMAGVFKPDPTIYAMAARYLGYEPGEIMMVASHKYDIRAAKALGFRTAFVARPLEFGTHGNPDVAFSDEFDLNAHDFLDLAAQLAH